MFNVRVLFPRDHVLGLSYHSSCDVVLRTPCVSLRITEYTILSVVSGHAFFWFSLLCYIQSIYTKLDISRTILQVVIANAVIWRLILHHIMLIHIVEYRRKLILCKIILDCVIIWHGIFIWHCDISIMSYWNLFCQPVLLHYNFQLS